MEYNFQEAYEQSIEKWIQRGRYSAKFLELSAELEKHYQRLRTVDYDLYDDINSTSSCLISSLGYQSFVLGLLFGMELFPFFEED